MIVEIYCLKEYKIVGPVFFIDLRKSFVFWNKEIDTTSKQIFSNYGFCTLRMSKIRHANILWQWNVMSKRRHFLESLRTFFVRLGQFISQKKLYHVTKSIAEIIFPIKFICPFETENEKWFWKLLENFILR